VPVPVRTDGQALARFDWRAQRALGWVGSLSPSPVTWRMVLDHFTATRLCRDNIRFPHRQGHFVLRPSTHQSHENDQVNLNPETLTETSRVTTGIPADVVGYLHRHHVMTRSTSSFTGMPHADTVVYSSDAHRPFFFAGDGTQMLRNLKDSRHVSFTIDDYTVDWHKVLELLGLARCVQADAETRAAPPSDVAPEGAHVRMVTAPSSFFPVGRGLSTRNPEGKGSGCPQALAT
jgi:Pyridoxamine 5'-phosphate oxidase